MAYLPRIEIGIYFLVYLCFLIYGVYQIVLLNKGKLYYFMSRPNKDLNMFFILVILLTSEYDGFSSGWSILNRKQDDLDYEWESHKLFFIKNCSWFLIHVILSEIGRSFKPSVCFIGII